MNLSDLVTARLRTLVPVWWGLVVAWALSQWPNLGQALHDLGIDPNSAAARAAVIGVCIWAWDYLWKRVEHVLPAWLTRIVVGSNKTPTYGPTTSDAVSTTVQPTPPTLLTPDERGDGTVPDAPVVDDIPDDTDASNDESDQTAA